VTTNQTEPEALARLIARCIAEGKSDILQDMREERVPTTVTSFSELHDYVDANEYGGLCNLADEQFAAMTTGDYDGANAVQDALDAWIKAGLPYTEAESIGALTAEYDAWNIANGLKLGSADEHLFDGRLTAEQRQWLSNFTARWDAAEQNYQFAQTRPGRRAD